MISVLDKLANAANGSNSTPAKVDSNITVQISLADADKIPDTLMKQLIAPLQKQLSDLQNQTNILSNRFAPKPAKV